MLLGIYNHSVIIILIITVIITCNWLQFVITVSSNSIANGIFFPRKAHFQVYELLNQDIFFPRVKVLSITWVQGALVGAYFTRNCPATFFLSAVFGSQSRFHSLAIYVRLNLLQWFPVVSVVIGTNSCLPSRGQQNKM